MKRTASPQSKAAPSSSEAGFTLTELLAALLVASMLIVGLAELTHRYARTSVRIRTVIAATHTNRVVQSMMKELERVDPGSLEVLSDRVTAKLGSKEIEGRITTGRGKRMLLWSSPSIHRQIDVNAEARFYLAPSGAVLLLGAAGEPPLAIAAPARDTPFDCAFDTISRACR